MKMPRLITPAIVRFAGVALIALAVTGCVSAVKTVVTAPFKVAGQATDWATTSQDESDRNRGRRDRKAEKREAKEQRAREKQERGE
jgi:hypothetical protein